MVSRTLQNYRQQSKAVTFACERKNFSGTITDRFQEGNSRDPEGNKEAYSFESNRPTL